MAVIHLIRHARPALAGVMLGRLDPPLANEDLAPSALEPVSVFTSPLQRARRTAELLFPDCTAIIVPELAEIPLGEWDGKTWSEIEAGWPELARTKLLDWKNVAPPGGEAWPAFEARVAFAWQRIRAAPSPCAIVAHAGVNAALAQLIDGRDATAFTQDYCEVTTFDIS